MKKNIIIPLLVLLIINVTAKIPPLGSAIGYIGDSIRLATFTTGHLMDTMPLFRWSYRTDNDNSVKDIYSVLDTIVTQMNETPSVYRYILCNAGLHDFIRLDSQTAPCVVPIDTFCKYWRLTIDELVDSFPNIELVWVDITPVKESVTWDPPGRAGYYNNTDKNLYNDSARAVFIAKGFNKRISHDSIIAANGLSPGEDGIHWSGAAYALFASNISRTIASWDTAIGGFDLTNASWIVSPAAMSQSALQDTTVMPTYSRNNQSRTIITGNSAYSYDTVNAVRYLNMASGRYLDVNNQFVFGDYTGWTLEMIIMPTSTSYQSVFYAAKDIKNYIGIRTYSNDLYVRIVADSEYVMNDHPDMLINTIHTVHLTCTKAGGTYLYIDGALAAGPYAWDGWPATYLVSDTCQFGSTKYVWGGTPYNGSRIYHLATYAEYFTAEKCAARHAMFPDYVSAEGIGVHTTDSVMYLFDDDIVVDTIAITKFRVYHNSTDTIDSVYVDGSKATIGGGGKSVSLALDISASMTGADLTNAQTAAYQFVSIMEEYDRCAIIAFDDVADVVQSMTSDTTLLNAAIASLAIDGGTYIGKGAAKAISQLINESNSRTVIIYSDGRNGLVANDVPKQTVVDSANNNAINIYSIGIGVDADSVLLSYLATNTGGYYTYAPSSEDLADIYMQIRGDISMVIDIAPTDPMVWRKEPYPIVLYSGGDSAAYAVYGYYLMKNLPTINQNTYLAKQSFSQSSFK